MSNFSLNPREQEAFTTNTINSTGKAAENAARNYRAEDFTHEQLQALAQELAEENYPSTDETDPINSTALHAVFTMVFKGTIR